MKSMAAHGTKESDLRFAHAKVRRIMVQNEEVGRVEYSCPLVLSRATEFFLSELLQKAILLASEQKTKAVTRKTLEEVLLTSSKYSFINDFDVNESNQNMLNMKHDIKYVDDENANV